LSGVPLRLSTRTCAGHFIIIFFFGRASAARGFSIDELLEHWALLDEAAISVN
jgi:hypothetical protein